MCGLAALLLGVAVDCSAIPQPSEAEAPQPCDSPRPQATAPALVTEELSAFEAGLRRRGPDGTAAASFQLRSGATLQLRATLLQLRGAAPGDAVLRHADGSALCFNGEVFGGGVAVPQGGSDSAALLQALAAAAQDVPAVLSAVRGPWALAYFHALTSTLWFGRDVLGRRSLLLRRPQQGQVGLLLASVAPLVPPGSPRWEELPPGLYSVELTGSAAAVRRHEWRESALRELADYRRREAVAQQPQPSVDDAAGQLLLRLDAAVARRVACGGAVAQSATGVGHASVLILFSGGVDSTLLAALADRHVPSGEPIDLSNVCFAAGASADRLAARSAVQELQRVAPRREWRLIEVEGSLDALAQHRTHLLALLQPRCTVMDVNIGFALWLAACGEGLWCGVPYASRARIALLGTGADEQTAGYSRHRATFQAGGANALSAELETEVRRLWERNLGRDDRLVADTSREARHPFLDEELVAWLAQAPLAHIADLARPPGEGDKRVLRDAARALGLPEAAARVKRAIQFGCGLGKAAAVQSHGSRRAAAAHGGGRCRVVLDAP